MAITRTDTTDPIGTTAIPGAHHTTMGTATVTIGIITTTITKLIEDMDASELARIRFRASSFFCRDHVIVYARPRFAGPPSQYLTALTLEPCLREAGEIWKKIAGSVDEHHREQIFRSGPDDTESHSAYCQDNDRIGHRVECARI
jgi:hypothetical protein